MESSEIDLSEFQEENRGDRSSGDDKPDSATDADGQVGNTTDQKAAGTSGEVSLTRFTFKLFFERRLIQRWGLIIL